MNEPVEQVMTTGSWIYMIVVWGMILALNFYAFRKMFGKK
jgi:hypothetical protein